MSVLLREMNSNDLDLLFKWENDKNNWLYSGLVEPYSKFDLLTFIKTKQDLIKDTQKRFMIENNTSNNCIGCIDLFDYNETEKSVSIGVLIDKEFEGKGFGSMALKVLIELAINDYNIKVFNAKILFSNNKSVHLFERNGFVKKGNLKNYIYNEKSYKQCVYEKKVK